MASKGFGWHQEKEDHNVKGMVPSVRHGGQSALG